VNQLKFGNKSGATGKLAQQSVTNAGNTVLLCAPHPYPGREKRKSPLTRSRKKMSTIISNSEAVLEISASVVLTLVLVAVPVISVFAAL
jgi:hypothetical protein